MLVAPAFLQAEDPPGKAVYLQKCASCHGPNGEGTEDNYAYALVGDRPLADLTELIVETMPAGAPEECVGEEAAQVAAYIYDAFYSPIAQARNKPARLELSRLTVRQYENAVADLIGSFRGNGKWDAERGLRGEYFKTRRYRKEDRVIERRDAVVAFDFGASSPDPEKIGTEEFAIRWQGSLLAPETGDYEIILDTHNGTRLWLNDSRQPFIDAGVKSGDQTEYRKTIRLLGGRTYYLRIEFFKTKGDKSAAVALKWKPPHQADEVIPQRNLSPHWVPEVLVVDTPFPPDDRSIGYERGTAISKEWDRAATYAAIEVADKLVRHLSPLAGVKDDAADRDQKIREFCRKFVERAFRRPLSDSEQHVFIDRQFDGAAPIETAVKRVVLLALKSPRFLYREAAAPGFDDYDTASWLSFTLWDSLPDKPLLEAAAKGQLKTREQIAGQAQRMVGDLRTRSKVRQFLHQWLNVDRMHDLSKDGELYPEFGDRLASDLRVSLDLLLDDIVWSETSDYRQLLLADELFLNGRLARFYGVDLPADAPFQKVVLDPQKRAGVLSHPYLMSGFAYYATSSPIHRGVFLSRSVLGRSLKPPPEAVNPFPPDLHADLTTRERVHLQTSAVSCQTCHAMINPLGFSLEHFDAVGRYRTEDRGKPIDATGFYKTRSGDKVQFTGVRELGRFLAGSEEAHEAFVEQTFNYLVKQPIQAFGPDHLTHLRQSFTKQNFNIQRLLVELATASALKAKELQNQASTKQVSAAGATP